ncbi:MAG: hypothetical protein V4591_07805, partial [Bdellovibrionota bacterium]
EGKTWKKIVDRVELKSGENCLHLCGLLSDGNVHSHIDHLFALIAGAKKFQIKKVRLHLLLDGRDVSPLSALDYIEKLEKFLSTLNDVNFDCKVASGGGRTFVTMDRYESDWSIVERGYNAHVLGEARAFSSIKNAIEAYRAENSFYDQDLPAFVISENNKPVGTVEENDSFILFNFRGDRAIEISRALTEEHFHGFERKRFPKIHYAGIMQYDGDLKIPENFLVSPPTIENTMTELLSAQKIKQFACSETQKFGHVTYFWNGNRSEKFNSKFEHYVEIPSDRISFSQRPWMKSAEIADLTIEQMKNKSFQIGRINFANGDMVGHTGDFAASIVAIGATDLALGRIMEAAKVTNTVLLVTADHGNADEMFEMNKKNNQVEYDKLGHPKPKTSHTLSPVPFAIYNEEALGFSVEFKTDLPHAGLANIASTVLELAGFHAPAFYEPSLIQFNATKPKEEVKLTSLLEKSLQQIALPTLHYAEEVSKAAIAVGFTWSTLKEVFRDIELEVLELKHEIEQEPINLVKLADETGDVLFSVANFIGFLKLTRNDCSQLDVDFMARHAIEKFVNRFCEMEKICMERGMPLTENAAKNMPVAGWMELWKEAKKRRYR